MDAILVFLTFTSRFMAVPLAFLRSFMAANVCHLRTAFRLAFWKLVEGGARGR
jgi:hypothetical protein